jgi:MFS family permease
MDTRNRIGLYGSYFLCMAGIGFTLPYLPLYLRQQGLSDRAIGFVSTLAALAGLIQFPAGVWSDRLRARKPFLLVALTVLAVSTFLLHGADGAIWLGFLVVLFAENGACRATVESMAGAEAVHLAPPGQVGAALGALRFWRPIGIMAVALAGSFLAKRYGPGSILLPVGIVQTLAVVAALLIHEKPAPQATGGALAPRVRPDSRSESATWRDFSLWAFVAAMILFHAAAAPGGVYLGLFLKQDLGASDGFLPYVFIVMMVAWMLVVWPAGALADRIGRKPLLVLAWSAMTVRLSLIAVVGSPEMVLLIQVLDGLAQGLFGVLAAAWVTDRFADSRRAGEAQVLVGSCLVLGSALGPLLAGLVVDALGYRGLFGLLAGVAGTATLVVLALVPETLPACTREPAIASVNP